jgi:signal transduction histidine kinase
MRRLVQAGPWLVAKPDLETVLERLLQIALETTGAHYAALGVLDEERSSIKEFVTRGLSDRAVQHIGPPPQGHGILGRLISDPRPLRLHDLTAHPEFYGFPPSHPPMRSFLGVPILIDGLAWGNLYLTEKEGGGDFTVADEEAVVLLADWAAVAIEHADVLEAAGRREHELARSLRRLQAMQTVAAAVGAQTDLQKILELIVEQGSALVEADGTLVMLAGGNELRVSAAAGAAAVPKEPEIGIAATLSGQVLTECQPARINDLQGEQRRQAGVLGVAKAHAALLVPLVYRGDAIGVIAAFDTRDSSSFDEEDEQIMTAFAASAAAAVATAQSIVADRLRHSLEAAEAERKHWARELHDETMQALGALKMIASSTRRNDDPEARVKGLDALVDGLELEIENLHAIISTLRPAALDDLGLRPAIEALAEQQQVANGFDVRLHLRLPDPAKSERRLRPEFEVAIYRLVQEALSNVAKHARASHVDLTVSANDRRVGVKLVDDGVGFDISQPAGGYGLTGMRERAELLGGQLELESDTGGTVVTASLPVAYVDETDAAESAAEQEGAGARTSLAGYWLRRLTRKPPAKRI